MVLGVDLSLYSGEEDKLNNRLEQFIKHKDPFLIELWFEPPRLPQLALAQLFGYRYQPGLLLPGSTVTLMVTP